jgi:hypothetical protein
MKYSFTLQAASYKLKAEGQRRKLKSQSQRNNCCKLHATSHKPQANTVNTIQRA